MESHQNVERRVGARHWICHALSGIPGFQTRGGRASARSSMTARNREDLLSLLRVVKVPDGLDGLFFADFGFRSRLPLTMVAAIGQKLP